MTQTRRFFGSRKRMSRLGPALRQQFVKGVKEALKTTAKESMKSIVETAMTKRPRIASVADTSLPSSSAPSPVSLAVPPVQFPALCSCKYEPSAPPLPDGNRQYICSSCSRSGMAEYKTVVEGRRFADLKGGKKTGKRRRMRLHLTKRMRVRHNSKNGRSRR